MRAGRFGMVMVIGFTVLGCARWRTAPASDPSRKVASGTAVFQFTRKVKGPVELTLDGARIPVLQRVKTGRHLVVKGLSMGKHRYFLSGSKDAFGPDQGEFEITQAHGVHLVTFSKNFDAVLYGKPDAAPAAEGLPGVQASLER